MIKINQYETFKKKFEKEFNEFPMFFAFSNEQFNEGMKKLGLKESETNKLLSIGAGGYIRKSDIRQFNRIFEKREQEFKDAIKNDLTGDGFIKQMFRYELENHEYYITRDLTETLEALELKMEDINNNKALMNGLNLAKVEYIKTYEKAEYTEDEEFED